MTSPTATILHRSQPKDKLNILTFDTHERYQINMARTGHNFYSYRVNDGDAPFLIKKWNPTYGEVPDNYTIFDADLKDKQIPEWIDFDIVLSQNKFGQYQIAQQICAQLHIPMISLEHTLPMPYWPPESVQQTLKMRGHIDVFISEYSMKKWGFTDAKIIRHGIDIDVFKPQERDRVNKPISVVNDFVNRDIPCGFSLWREVVDGMDFAIWGDTPGLSKPTQGISHLVSLYNDYSIFLNTSQISPIPTALMEAMACGCVPVSTNNCMIPEVITHGENGLLSNDPKELKQFIIDLQNNHVLRTKLSENARETIRCKFALSNFVNDWNKVFEESKDLLYLGEHHK